MITLPNVLLSLRPNSEFTTIGDEIIWLDTTQTEPTAEEIEAERIRLEADYVAKQYQRDRQYPSIQEQLDMQYWDSVNGTTVWADTIAAVKAANPKPE